VALGFKALELNTTGANNSGLGFATLNANTTGASNVAVGHEALNANTTASSNTAVGYQAGYSNTTGFGNAYLGKGAGYTNTTAAYNVFIGFEAGYSYNTSGNTFNTFVGVQSGYAVTTGSKNTILGGYSGNNGGLDIRTSNNYIVLSDGDGNPLISTADNQTVALEGAVPNSGTGIAFPATQSASSDANTLDDYEEGTWTPVDGSGSGLSFTSDGTYTKIGRQVLVQGNVVFPSTANGNSVVIGGLPFTSTLNGGGFCMYSTTAFGFVMRNATNSTNMLVTNVTTPSVAIVNASFSGATFQFTFIYNA
jgi:hypothetical protein